MPEFTQSWKLTWSRKEGKSLVWFIYDHGLGFGMDCGPWCCSGTQIYWFPSMKAALNKIIYCEQSCLFHEEDFSKIKLWLFQKNIGMKKWFPRNNPQKGCNASFEPQSIPIPIPILVSCNKIPFFGTWNWHFWRESLFSSTQKSDIIHQKQSKV